MAEPEDVVLSILRNIQTDLGDVKRMLAEHSQKLEVIEDYMTYALGISRSTGPTSAS